MHHYRIGYKFCSKISIDRYRFDLLKRRTGYYGGNHGTRNYYKSIGKSDISRGGSRESISKSSDQDIYIKLNKIIEKINE